jgi:hypothetical protein
VGENRKLERNFRVTQAHEALLRTRNIEEFWYLTPNPAQNRAK